MKEWQGESYVPTSETVGILCLLALIATSDLMGAKASDVASAITCEFENAEPEHDASALSLFMLLAYLTGVIVGFVLPSVWTFMKNKTTYQLYIKMSLV